MSKKTSVPNEIDVDELRANEPRVAASAPAPVPTLGRVVLFHYRENQDRVATIVGVKDATTVDLHVHMLVAADQREPVVEVLGVIQGESLGCWSWPPRA